MVVIHNNIGGIVNIHVDNVAVIDQDDIQVGTDNGFDAALANAATVAQNSENTGGLESLDDLASTTTDPMSEALNQSEDAQPAPTFEPLTIEDPYVSHEGTPVANADLSILDEAEAVDPFNAALDDLV